MIDLNLGIGIGGMLCIVTAFVLDEFYKRFNQNTVQYNLLNIIGSALLLYYGYTISAWPFIVMNGIWFVAAGVKLGDIVR